MPSLSCRDVDEICDWFLREEDPGRLVVHAIVHNEDQHQRWLKGFMDGTASGKKHVADLIDDYIKLMRWP